MSKYTEAIESLGTIFKCYACDMEVADCMECDFLHETCLEALEIADRLEQADIKKVIANNNKLDFKNRNIISKEEMGYRNGFLDGYNQALADVRGDAE